MRCVTKRRGGGGGGRGGRGRREFNHTVERLSWPNPFCTHTRVVCVLYTHTRGRGYLSTDWYTAHCNSSCQSPSRGHAQRERERGRERDRPCARERGRKSERGFIRAESMPIPGESQRSRSSLSPPSLLSLSPSLLPLPLILTTCFPLCTFSRCGCRVLNSTLVQASVRYPPLPCPPHSTPTQSRQLVVGDRPPGRGWATAAGPARHPVTTGGWLG